MTSEPGVETDMEVFNQIWFDAYLREASGTTIP